ncbi:MAG: hypothetical protein WCJ72_13085 [Chryseobacterium sp.]
MQINNKILELGKKLPLGARKVIADRLNISYRTVDNILKGKEGRMNNVINVVQEAKKVLVEFEEGTKID